MADESPAAPTEPAVVADAKPAEADPKAAINEALKKSGVRLKAKDREHVPRDIDDLTSKANRVFGLETELEAFKKDRTEAEKVKSWRAAIESDDEGAAEQAFELLSPKGQQAAAKWLQKKAEAWEKERALPPEAQELKRRNDEHERELQGYRQREQQQQQEAQRQQQARDLREANEGVLKVAKGVIESFKVDVAKAPRANAALTPFVARHMRVAMQVEAETGSPVDPLEIQENVRQDVAQSFAAVAEGMGDDTLYDAMGEAVVKRLLKAHLLRVKGIKPGVKPNGATKAAESTRDPTFGTPAYLR